jgi:putative ABC transport system ATP-binding protein
LNRTIFRIRDVTKRYDGPQGHAGFELAVPQLNVHEGQRIGIVAGSGFGKSTLLDLLVFASRPTSGEVFEFNVPRQPATNILDEWQRGRTRVFSELRKRHIGVVLQTGGLLPFLTARGNIELPLKLAGAPPPVPVTELAERLGLEHQLNHYPRQLSIGQRQRVAIARALVHHPLLIVADEPTASLDRNNADKVMSLLVELAEVVGVTLVVATHDPHLVDKYGFDVLEHTHEVDGSTGTSRSTFFSAEEQ